MLCGRPELSTGPPYPERSEGFSMKSTSRSAIRQRSAKHRSKGIITMAAIVAAISIPASVAWSSGVQAGANSRSAPACASLSGSPSTSVTMGECTPAPAGMAAKGYKKGRLQLSSAVIDVLSAGGTITETMTWTHSGTATTVQFSGMGSSPASCKQGSTELDLVGSVIGASTSGRGIPAVGDALKAAVCLSPSQQFTLAKGFEIPSVVPPGSLQLPRQTEMVTNRIAVVGHAIRPPSSVMRWRD